MVKKFCLTKFHQFVYLAHEVEAFLFKAEISKSKLLLAASANRIKNMKQPIQSHIKQLIL